MLVCPAHADIQFMLVANNYNYSNKYNSALLFHDDSLPRCCYATFHTPVGVKDC